MADSLDTLEASAEQIKSVVIALLNVAEEAVVVSIVQD